MEQPLSPDASRIGKAVEYLVASTCILASDARLNVSTAMIDDEGVDLIFHLRDHTATLSVQVKARTTTTSLIQKQAMFRAQVRPQTFKPRDDLFMLFVLVEKRTASIEWVWLVPSKVFDAVAPRTGKGLIRFTASSNPNSKDQWQQFRYERDKLADRVIEILSSLEREQFDPKRDPMWKVGAAKGPPDLAAQHDDYLYS